MYRFKTCLYVQYMLVIMQCLAKSHSVQFSLHILFRMAAHGVLNKTLCDYINCIQYMCTVSPDHVFVSSLSAEGSFFSVEHVAG
jgi:hypothetical protein